MRIHKHDIAKFQLQTAIDIFLRGRDRSSAITLAGAASGILDTLVRRAGKEAFVDYARRVFAAQEGHTPKRRSYWHHMEKLLGVIPHKHLAEDDPEFVELDLESQAFNAISRAIADYIALNGQDEPFVKAFLGWAWKNKDGPASMEKFKDVPKQLRARQ